MKCKIKIRFTETILRKKCKIYFTRQPYSIIFLFEMWKSMAFLIWHGRTFLIKNNSSLSNIVSKADIFDDFRSIQFFNATFEITQQSHCGSKPFSPLFVFLKEWSRQVWHLIFWTDIKFSRIIEKFQNSSNRNLHRVGWLHPIQSRLNCSFFPFENRMLN